jgi:hypothetical protein
MVEEKTRMLEKATASILKIEILVIMSPFFRMFLVANEGWENMETGPYSYQDNLITN